MTFARGKCAKPIPVIEFSMEVAPMIVIVTTTPESLTKLSTVKAKLKRRPA